MTSYTVRGKAEEFDCGQCGCPVYHGDRAFQHDSDGEPFCSRKCADDHEQREEERAARLARFATRPTPENAGTRY